MAPLPPVLSTLPASKELGENELGENLKNENLPTNLRSDLSSDLIQDLPSDLPEDSDDDLIYIGDNSKKFGRLSQTRSTGPVEIQVGKAVVAYSVGSDESILDSLLDAGQDPPFSCKSGICMSCLAVVEEGCVVQDELAALSDEDVAEGKALMCQSRPASSSVRVRFLD